MRIAVVKWMHSPFAFYTMESTRVLVVTNDNNGRYPHWDLISWKQSYKQVCNTGEVAFLLLEESKISHGLSKIQQ